MIFIVDVRYFTYLTNFVNEKIASLPDGNH